jgi:hypothetical protein
LRFFPSYFNQFSNLLWFFYSSRPSFYYYITSFLSCRFLPPFISSFTEAEVMLGPPTPTAPTGGYLGDVIGGSFVLGVLSGSSTAVAFKEQLIITHTSGSTIETVFAFEAKCSDSFSSTLDGTVVSPTTTRGDGYKVYRLDAQPRSGGSQNIETYEASFGTVSIATWYVHACVY